MKYCAQCGAQLVDEAVVCPKCGCAVAPVKTVDPNASPKSRLITLLLCIFVGGLGIHRFYVGKIGTGVLWLLTAGCFGTLEVGVQRAHGAVTGLSIGGPVRLAQMLTVTLPDTADASC